jgi:hypothetical protein
MSTPIVVNEPVVVETHFLPGGEIQPVAFVWRGQTRHVADHGRTWQETAVGTTWLCYLVRTVNHEAFELRLNAAGGQWLLAQAWLQEYRA